MTDQEDVEQELAIKRALVDLLPQLRRFCMSLTASSADADDLCQATCERAIRRLGQWTPGTRLDSWLYRMAQNLQKNALRDHGNRCRLLESHAAVGLDGRDQQASPVERVQECEIRRHVLALPDPLRDVLFLICVEGHSYRECAELLGLSLTTVTNRLFQARIILRRAMESDAPHDVAQERRAAL